MDASSQRDKLDEPQSGRRQPRPQSVKRWLTSIVPAALAGLWAVGLVTGYTLGNLIHLLLLIAVLLWTLRWPRMALAILAMSMIASYGWYRAEIEPDNPTRSNDIEQAPPAFRSDLALLPADDLLGFVRVDGERVPGPSASLSRTDSAKRSTRDPAPIGTFLIGKYEVTVGQYRECVKTRACVPRDARALNGNPDFPVRYLSWNEVGNYVTWLDRRIKRAMPARLADVIKALPGPAAISVPTEEEWQLAAAGTEGRTYPWGLAFDASAVNGGTRTRSMVMGVGRQPRGATPSGIFDMSGNVAEWTSSTPDPTADEETARLTYRVVRGGSYYDGPSLMTTTARTVANGSSRYDFVGFRIVYTTRGARSAAAAAAY